ncbi:MAG: S41 family peptidase [Clostridia bacterium]|nr:S41 family peptidase [Clostridia bacterium]
MNNKKVAVITAVVSAVIAGSTAWCFRGLYDIYAHKDIYTKVAGVESVLNNDFLYDYDSEKLADYAALGMTMSLEDPYTVYYNKKQFTEYTDDAGGDFIGIGVTVVWDKENDEIEVTSVMDNSPGKEAGILPGDVIVAVEGERYTGTQMNEAVSKIKGTELENPENTSVTVTVMRKNKELDLTLVRKRIHQETVTCEMIDGEIGIIRISAFNTSSKDGEKSTDEEFESALDTLNIKGMKKLIIDLRDNGGGDLGSVSNIIDMIVPEGLIMYSENKYGKREELTSDENELNIPIAVIVNGNSASASELMTGALKDYGKAKIIGTKTFGKGVMQAIYPFIDGSGMVVTIAKYFTPGGTCVHDEGITPDIVSELPDDVKDLPVTSIPRDKDVQLQAAIDCLKSK